MRMHPLHHLEGIRCEAARGVLLVAVLGATIPVGLALQHHTPWVWLPILVIALTAYNAAEWALGLTPPDDGLADAADVEAARERARDAEQEAADLRGDLETEQMVTATLTAALSAPGTVVCRETAWSLRGAVGDELVARLIARSGEVADDDAHEW